MHQFEPLLPYVGNSFSSVVALKIESIQCYTNIVHWVQLDCVVLNDENASLVGQSIYVQYFDLNVPDFIILWESYESSIESYGSTHVNDEIKVVFSETEIHPATVASISYSADPRWPFSPWQAYSIVWKDANGADANGFEAQEQPLLDRCSIWESLDAERKCTDELSATDRKRLCEFFESLKSSSFAKPFLTLVSLDMFPSYSSIVPYPMSLNLIIDRLDGNFYRRIEALKWDCNLILSNAMLFNEDSSDIIKKASILHEKLIAFIDEHVKPTKKISDRALEARFARYRFKEQTLTFGSNLVATSKLTSPRRSDRLTKPDVVQCVSKRPLHSSANSSSAKPDQDKFVIVPRRSIRIFSLGTADVGAGKPLGDEPNNNRLSSSKDLPFSSAPPPPGKKFSASQERDFRRTSSRLSESLSKSRIGVEDFSINSSDVEERAFRPRQRTSRKAI